MRELGGYVLPSMLALPLCKANWYNAGMTWLVVGLVIYSASLIAFFAIRMQRDMRSPLKEVILFVGIAVPIIIVQCTEWPGLIRFLIAVAAGYSAQVILWLLFRQMSRSLSNH